MIGISEQQRDRILGCLLYIQDTPRAVLVLLVLAEERKGKEWCSRLQVLSEAEKYIHVKATRRRWEKEVEGLVDGGFLVCPEEGALAFTQKGKEAVESLLSSFARAVLQLADSVTGFPVPRSSLMPFPDDRNYLKEFLGTVGESIVLFGEKLKTMESAMRDQSVFLQEVHDAHEKTLQDLRDFAQQVAQLQERIVSLEGDRDQIYQTNDQLEATRLKIIEMLESLREG